LPDVETPKTPNKVKYTLHFTKTVYTEELCELYKRYELAVHKKEKEASNLKRHLCNSPIYDETIEQEISGTKPPERDDIDEKFNRDDSDCGV
jgi:hypothetical protein